LKMKETYNAFFEMATDILTYYVILHSC